MDCRKPWRYARAVRRSNARDCGSTGHMSFDTTARQRLATGAEKQDMPACLPLVSPTGDERATMHPYGITPHGFWIDHLGRQWAEPTIKGRLKMRIPSHRALREFIIHRDGARCVLCGARESLVADHIVSRRNGGRHHPSNMQCMCDSCNARKAGLTDAKFQRECA